MSQYIRDRWGTEQGFPRGPVYAIAQSTDGYLWIGTQAGLVRFDGLSFRLVQDAPPSFTITSALGLMSDKHGNLWVRLEGSTLLRYRDGMFNNPASNLRSPHSRITAMCQGNEGDLLASQMEQGVITYRQGRFEMLADAGALPRSPVLSVAQTPNGDIWMGTRDAGLFRLRGGQISTVTKGLPDLKINCLLSVGEGELWIGTDNGIVRWDGTRLTAAGIPPALNHLQILAMARDRDGNIWLGTDSRGLLRFNARGVSSLEGDDRSPEAVTAIFEDREGNLWIGSANGIERLRDSVFVTYSTSEGLPSESNGPVYIDSNNRVWFAPATGGLYWLKDRQVGRVRQAGLDGDVVYSIAGDRGDLWLGRQRGGLTRLRFKGELFTAETFTHAAGLAQNSVYSVHQNRSGTVWAGTLSGGVSRYQDGKFTTYTTANSLPSNTVAAIAEGSDGTMWFATPNGLSALSKDHWQVYQAKDGMPSPNTNCMIQDSAGVLWIGTVNGLAYLRDGRVQIPARLPASLREQILGISEDRNGSLWIATLNHVLQVNRDQLLQGTLRNADVREYGVADGLRGSEGVKRDPSVAADPLGRIWFSLNRGLSVVDPARVTASAAPAIAHVQTISADGDPIDLQKPVRISPPHRRITFGFAGLTLSIPERVRFKYMLEGFDRGWSEAVATREAIYTNLSPGSYHFHVLASNSDGQWNGTEAAIAVDIDPAFWQTWWFRASCAAVFLLSVLTFSRVRMHQMKKRLSLSFDERLAERTRLARELHDTLLQTIQGSKIIADVALDEPADSARMRRALVRVSGWLAQAMQEGRAALNSLRTSTIQRNDLAEDLQRAGEDCPINRCMEFRLSVEGIAKEMHPIVRDEVYRIGYEAIRNAFLHSEGSRVSVKLSYERDLSLRVRDDGKGMEPDVAATGRGGHFGLQGMRERAARIGSRFSLISSACSGTEIILVVPGNIVFAKRDRFGTSCSRR